jgi:hypothetical protein
MTAGHPKAIGPNIKGVCKAHNSLWRKSMLLAPCGGIRSLDKSNVCERHHCGKPTLVNSSEVLEPKSIKINCEYAVSKGMES